jgi:hypothetical protein
MHLPSPCCSSGPCLSVPKPSTPNYSDLVAKLIAGDTALTSCLRAIRERLVANNGRLCRCASVPSKSLTGALSLIAVTTEILSLYRVLHAADGRAQSCCSNKAIQQQLAVSPARSRSSCAAQEEQLQGPPWTVQCTAAGPDEAPGHCIPYPNGEGSCCCPAPCCQIRKYCRVGCSCMVRFILLPCSVCQYAAVLLQLRQAVSAGARFQECHGGAHLAFSGALHAHRQPSRCFCCRGVLVAHMPGCTARRAV